MLKVRNATCSMRRAGEVLRLSAPMPVSYVYDIYRSGLNLVYLMSLAYTVRPPYDLEERYVTRQDDSRIDH